MLDNKTLEWLEARKNPNYFCKTYCPWFCKIDNSEKCTIPLMPCVLVPSPYETQMAEDFDRTVAERVEMYLHEDMPCIHSRNILCCPQCYTDKNFEFVTRKKPNNYIKCGTDCLTRTARIELEDELDEALIDFYSNMEGENEAD